MAAETSACSIAPDTIAFWLGSSQIIVGALALIVVFFALFEYSKLKQLREDFRDFQAELERRSYRSQRAIHRIIASYQVRDIDQKIALIKSAVDSDPKAFNVYNALGYAYLEKKDIQGAISSFKDATVAHPESKDGWFDLAGAYLSLDVPREDLAREAIQTAIKMDASAYQDALADSRFKYMV